METVDLLLFFVLYDATFSVLINFFVPERDVRIFCFANAKLKFNKNIANIKKVRIFAVLKTTRCP